MLTITPELGDAILAHARLEEPREACGLVVRRGDRLDYVPCKNSAMAELAHTQFAIDQFDWVAAEDSSDEVLAVVHSHPGASAHATHADLVGCEKSMLPWIIIGLPDGVIKQYEPTGQRLPLVGRVFHHGLVDCYSLIRDYYWMRLGIDLPDFERPDEWWERGEGKLGMDLYRENFRKAGFVEVGKAADIEPIAHDVILMQVRADVPNHAAVMDGARPGEILHHLYRRLSGHDVWGGSWKYCASSILRHESLIDGAGNEA